MKTQIETLPKSKTLKFIMLLMIASAMLIMTSCKSSWSCKKRYVNSSMELSTEYIKKHQQGKQSFDNYILNKNAKI